MSKYQIVPTERFKKDLKTAIRRGYNLDLIGAVVDTLAAGDDLPEKYCDHDLIGNYKGCPGILIPGQPPS